MRLVTSTITSKTQTVEIAGRDDRFYAYALFDNETKQKLAALLLEGGYAFIDVDHLHVTLVKSGTPHRTQLGHGVSTHHRIETLESSRSVWFEDTWKPLGGNTLNGLHVKQGGIIKLQQQVLAKLKQDGLVNGKAEALHTSFYRMPLKPLRNAASPKLPVIDFACKVDRVVYSSKM